jgi:hypothetical protein
MSDMCAARTRARCDDDECVGATDATAHARTTSAEAETGFEPSLWRRVDATIGFDSRGGRRPTPLVAKE